MNMNKYAIYCTSFCDFGHDMKTGRPVGHECYIIPPKLLEAEIDLPIEEAIKLWTPWYNNKGPRVKGRKRRHYGSKS